MAKIFDPKKQVKGSKNLKNTERTKKEMELLDERKEQEREFEDFMKKVEKMTPKKRMLLAEETTNPLILDELSFNENCLIVAVVAQNKNISKETRERFIEECEEDLDLDILVALLKNQNTSKKSFKKLKKIYEEIMGEEYTGQTFISIW